MTAVVGIGDERVKRAVHRGIAGDRRGAVRVAQGERRHIVLVTTWANHVALAVVRSVRHCARYSDRLSRMQQTLHVALDRACGSVAAALGGRISAQRVETKRERICAGGYPRAQKKDESCNRDCLRISFHICTQVWSFLSNPCC